MIRFDFLRDGGLSVVDRTRAALIAAPLRGPLLAAGGLTLALGILAAGETLALRSATDVEQREAARYVAVQASFQSPRASQTRQRQRAETLAHVRSLRRSGYRVARELARIANRLPAGTWLTAIDRTPDGYALTGAAENLVDVSALLASLSGSNGLNPDLGRVDAVPDAVRFTVGIAVTP